MFQSLAIIVTMVVTMAVVVAMAVAVIVTEGRSRSRIRRGRGRAMLVLAGHGDVGSRDRTLRIRKPLEGGKSFLFLATICNSKIWHTGEFRSDYHLT